MIDVTVVAIAVVMYHGTVARLTEIVETGVGGGRAESIFLDVAAGHARKVARDFLGARQDLLGAPFVCRYVRYTVNSFGSDLVVTEFHPPLERHRYVEIVQRDGEAIELPGWVGRELSGDPDSAPYVIAVDEYRARSAFEKGLPK
jgi:hypothetical protein